jgi:pachytene checkpoint protein 2
VILSAFDYLKLSALKYAKAISQLRSECLPQAFVDRADLAIYVGPPSLEARYAILRSCMAELQRVGIIGDGVQLLDYMQVWQITIQNALLI